VERSAAAGQLRPPALQATERSSRPSRPADDSTSDGRFRGRARTCLGAVWGDACGGLLCALAAAAAATAATVVHSGCPVLRRLLLDRQVFRPGHSGRPAVNPPAFSPPTLASSNGSSPSSGLLFFLSSNPALQAISLSSLALQATHFAGHNWRHVVLLISSNWLVLGATSRRRVQWAPVGAGLAA
jgi:hypothetical protein